MTTRFQPAPRIWALTIVSCLITGSPAGAEDPLLGDLFNDTPAERAAIENAEADRQVQLRPILAQPRVAEPQPLAEDFIAVGEEPSVDVVFQPAVDAGLNGVIGTAIPTEIGVETLYTLSEPWWDWADQTTAALTALYSGELDVAGQRDTLTALRGQAEALRAGSVEAVDATERDLMTVIAGRILRRVELFSAILDATSVDAGAARQGHLASAYTQASNSLNELTHQLSHMRNNEAWFDFIEAPGLEAALLSQGADPAAMDVVARVHEKLAARHRLSDVQAAFLSRSMFVNLESALEGVLAASAMPQGLSYGDTLRALATELVAATEQYQNEISSSSSATIRRVLAQWSLVAVDGGTGLGAVVNRNYFNYNVRITVSEGMMQRVVNERRREGDRINQQQNCMTITGRQCTTTDVTVDFRPCEESAKFTVILNGRVSTRATADVACISVYSNGCHCFHAEKDVCFDGFDFCISRARVGARANNQMVDASSHVSRVPLLGRAVDNFALNAAEQKKEETDQQVASQIRREVATQFNRELYNQFHDAPYRIEDEFYGPLREQGIMPETLVLSTTEDVMLVRARTMEPHEVAGNAPYLTPAVPAAGLLIQIHESALNNGFDRMNLAGRVMTETEFQAEIEDRLSELLNQEVDLPDPVVEPGQEATVNTFIFAEEDPLRFVFEDNTVYLILRTGLQRDTGDIPTKKITIPMVFSVEEEGIVSRVRLSDAGNPEIRVEPAAPTTPAAHLREAPIMRGVIQRSIQDSTRDSRLELDIEDKTIELFVRQIQSADGWLSVILE